MHRRRVWLVGAAAAAMVAIGASPSGQTAGVPEADYATAVRAYVEGHDAWKAATPLAAWTHDRFKNAVERYLAQPEALPTAAAAFHLEISIGVVILSPVLAARHLDFGHQIVTYLRAPSSNPRLPLTDAVVFAERWYAAAASTFLMVNDSSRALPFINRGLQVAPTSLALRLMTGIVDELSALSTAPELATTSERRGRIQAARRQSFMRARDKFANLLADEPRFTRARIRLGRVLWMLDEHDAALVELLRAQSEARAPADRYLAAMFLGASYQQQGNQVGARVAYETAPRQHHGGRASACGSSGDREIVGRLVD